MSDPWFEGIPPKGKSHGPRIDVWTPTYYYPIEATLLTRRLFCRWKHFDPISRRAYVCSTCPDCPACQAGVTRYATGWIACCSANSSLWGILQLSDHALDMLREYAVRKPVDRGLMVRTRRRDTRPNAMMLLDLVGQDPREYLPKEFDPRETLEHMWGVADARRLNPETLPMPAVGKRLRQPRQGG